MAKANSHGGVLEVLPIISSLQAIQDGLATREQVAYLRSQGLIDKNSLSLTLSGFEMLNEFEVNKPNKVQPDKLNDWETFKKHAVAKRKRESKKEQLSLKKRPRRIKRRTDAQIRSVENRRK